MNRPQPSPWWVPILLAFLGLTACFLTVAYLSWIQVAGKLYVFGLVMVLANLAATIAAIVATGMDARSGRWPGRGGRCWAPSSSPAWCCSR